MDGCVPDSIRYVPGLRGLVAVPNISVPVVPAATSVENDCTRERCAGGVPTPIGGVPGGVPAMGQVTGCALEWSGLTVEVAVVPRPPPNWPTITNEVGKLFAPNERLLVRLIVRVCPVGTVITTGDQPAGGVAGASGAFGFNARQVAGAATAGAPP